LQPWREADILRTNRQLEESSFDPNKCLTFDAKITFSNMTKGGKVLITTQTLLLLQQHFAGVPKTQHEPPTKYTCTTK